MSEFKEYKPMEIEHNVKAAVENLRKAYWSNETKKVAKHYTEAEDIIISAICHHHYTVCKETTEGDLISREALKKEVECTKETGYDTNNEPLFDYIELSTLFKIIDNAPTVDAIVNTIEVRPQGKWIDHTAAQNLLWGQLECPFCHKRSNRGASYCQYCGARLENSEE